MSREGKEGRSPIQDTESAIIEGEVGGDNKPEALPAIFQERGGQLVVPSPEELKGMIESGELDAHQLAEDERFEELLEVVSSGLATAFSALLALGDLRRIVAGEREEGEAGGHDVFLHVLKRVEPALYEAGLTKYAVEMIGEGIGDALSARREHGVEKAVAKRDEVVRKETIEADPRIGEYNAALEELRRRIGDQEERLDIRLPEQLEELRPLLLEWNPEDGVGPLWPDVELVDRSIPENAKAPIVRFIIKRNNERRGVDVILQRQGKVTKKGMNWSTEREAFLPNEVRNRERVQEDAARINVAREEFLPALREGGVVEITTVDVLKRLQAALSTIDKENNVVLFGDDGLEEGLEAGTARVDISLSGSKKELQVTLWDLEDGNHIRDILTMPVKEGVRS